MNCPLCKKPMKVIATVSIAGRKPATMPCSQCIKSGRFAKAVDERVKRIDKEKP